MAAILLDAFERFLHLLALTALGCALGTLVIDRRARVSARRGKPPS